MTDWHCHILPGLDDGPSTIEESVEMARALAHAGYATVYCTPHLIKGMFEADNAAVRMALVALQAELIRQEVGLRLLPGREYYLDEFFADHLRDPLPLGETRLLLVEIPNHTPVEYIKETLFRLKSAGYNPLIAHPERCRLFDLPNTRKKLFEAFTSKLVGDNPESEHSSLLTYLREIGCKFQGNLGSFAGFYGKLVRRQAEQHQATGLYTHYGSDLHSAGQRGVLLPCNIEGVPNHGG